MKNEKICKICFLCIIVAVVLVALVITLKWDAIFQRGNPIPYLKAASRLSDGNTFEAIENMDGIYITKSGDNQDLFQMIQDTYGWEYEDQLGRGYFFSDGDNNHMVESEIYWRNFEVWTIPIN